MSFFNISPEKMVARPAKEGRDDTWAQIACDMHEGMGQVLDPNSKSIFRGDLESLRAAQEHLPAFALCGVGPTGSRIQDNLNAVNNNSNAKTSAFDTFLSAVAGTEDVQWQHRQPRV